MTEQGFPWSTQSRDPEKEGVPPAEDHVVPTTEANKHNEHTDPVYKNNTGGQTTLLRESNNPQGKRRNGSLRGPPRLITPGKDVASDSAVYKAPPDASSPLPVRTIPRTYDAIDLRGTVD